MYIHTYCLSGFNSICIQYEYICVYGKSKGRTKKTYAIRLHTECAVYRRRRRHHRVHLWPCTQYSHKSHTVAVASSRWMYIEHDLRVAAFCFSLLVPLFSLLFIFSLRLSLYLFLVLSFSHSPALFLSLFFSFLSLKFINRFSLFSRC